MSRRAIAYVVLTVLIVVMGVGAGLVFSSADMAQQRPPPVLQATPQHTSWIEHHVVIQIDQNDPASMNLALNNATNLQDYWDKKGEKGQIEFVAFGPGLAMVRSDQSPVRDRIMTLSKRGMVFSGCHNTEEKQSAAEGKPVTLLSGVVEVSTGVARIVELEEQGYTYLRP
jgi:intracellular sulfur oxidation DsrE/DsrF family protein